MAYKIHKSMDLAINLIIINDSAGSKMARKKRGLRVYDADFWLIISFFWVEISIYELELTRIKAGAALMFYTQTPVYLEAVCAGGNRFDLSGQPCGAMTEKQKAYAQEQLEK